MADNTEKNTIGFYKVLNSGRLDETRKDHPASFIHFHDEGKEDNLYIGDCRITDNFNIRNVPDKANTVKVGGLDPTTIGVLKDKSLSEIVMQMICPRTPPELPISKPSMTISYSGNRLVKVGSNLPAKEDIIITCDKGKWSDGTVYAGEPSNTDISISPGKWGETSDEGNYVISGSIIFGAGPKPKDSYGEEYDDNYTGGTVISNEIKITSVYPIYATTYFGTDDKGDISKLIEQPLQDYVNNEDVSFEITVPPEEDGNLNKFKIYLPFEKKPTVKQYNPVSGKYDIEIEMIYDKKIKITDYPDYLYHCYIRTKDEYDTKGPTQYEINLTR